MRFLNEINHGLLVLSVALSCAYLIFGLEDLLVDLVALVRRIRPRALPSEHLQSWKQQPQKRFAIIVPAWREGNIIDRMLVGNLERIDYAEYDIFVGVYPNDPETIEPVQRVAQHFPQVLAVIGDRPGPTSKGQILNCVVEQVRARERATGRRYDAYLMQDAEDIIHRHTLPLMNEALATHDFVQVPVFSLSVSAREVIAGTYVDEFAESHTKDLLVRTALGAAVPSAGVGTALSRALVESIWGEKGRLFNESSLTEDYELGLTAHRLGFSATFLSCYYRHPSTGRAEFIATREYFPKRFSRAVRQKTRWTIGIAFQGWRHLGWFGGFSNRFFLHRDRRGPLVNLAGFLGYPVAAGSLLYAGWISHQPLSRLWEIPWVRWLWIANALLMVNRWGQRSTAVARVYGLTALWPILLRWPFGNLINASAAGNALIKDLSARIRKTTLAWVKTEHELPTYFGRAASSLEGGG